MENHKASQSLWWATHKSPQWLQSTLSDIDEKTDAMLKLIEEDGDSFAQRSEMYYKKRPELVKMVEEFHRSYRSLAERFYQLKVESTQTTQSSSSSSSNYIKQAQDSHSSTKLALGCDDDSKLENPNSNPESVVEDPYFECEQKCTAITEIEGFDKKINGFKTSHEIEEDFEMNSFLEKDKTWTELRFQVSKLMEDNIRQQTELVRRNEEKREAIKELSSQLDRLMDENRALQNCLGCSSACTKQNPSQFSRLRALLSGRFSW
ncbi:protein NETWORKED 3C-like [Tasmannia lanceolata]|uniref:protein NETWORKED 3C-like n=1 Tax=Tasmannia lanceolata TaxID=3420 RepID=UPI0040632167